MPRPAPETRSQNGLGWAGLAGLQEGGNEADHMTPVIWGAGCSELQRTGMPEGPQIAPQNGLGWAGWAGLAGWLAYRRGPISVAEASASFGCAPPAGGRSQSILRGGA